MAGRLSDELDFILRSHLIDLTDVDDDNWNWGWERRTESWQVGRYLGRHLELELKSSGEDAEALLSSMVEHLEAIIRDPNPKTRHQAGETMVDALLEDLPYYTLLDIMKGFGWERERVVGEPRLCDMAKHVRGMLKERLRPRVNAMLESWHASGLFELSQRRRRQPAYQRPDVRQNTRDRLAGPDYRPPGRV